LDIQFYLDRIGHEKSIRPDIETLRNIHRAHILTVPFENLDIHSGEQIRLTEQALWEKIVTKKRGGFCYELNGMFAWLLNQIGFQVTYLNGRVYNEQGEYGRDFDHLALMVQIPGDNSQYLADVGFGDSFVEPLRIEFSSEQVQGPRGYRLEKAKDGINLCRRDFDGGWKRQYFFDLIPRNFPSDYEAACHYYQTSPKSSFTQKRIVTRATPTGRLTLDDRYLSITTDGQREKRPLENEDEFRELLKSFFGISIDPPASRRKSIKQV
jgi:N-hydroxyarylamine O-acetyltransferase